MKRRKGLEDQEFPSSGNPPPVFHLLPTIIQILLPIIFKFFTSLHPCSAYKYFSLSPVTKSSSESFNLPTSSSASFVQSLHSQNQQQLRYKNHHFLLKSRLPQFSLLPIFSILFIILTSIPTGLVTSLQLTSTSPGKVSANIGEDVILRCEFDFPNGIPIPYVVQWQKLGNKIPLYIW